MKLRGLSIDVVRNEWEYEKYVSEEYRKQHSWEDSKVSMPWIIVRFEKENSPTDQVTGLSLTMEPAADFTNISAAPSGEWSVGSDKTKLTVNLKDMNSIMLEVKKDAGFAELPSELKVTVGTVSAVWSIPDLTNTKLLLKDLDKKVLQQGEGYLGKTIYEMFAQQPVIKVVDALPESPKDNVLYVVMGK